MSIYAGLNSEDGIINKFISFVNEHICVWTSESLFILTLLTESFQPKTPIGIVMRRIYLVYKLLRKTRLKGEIVDHKFSQSIHLALTHKHTDRQTDMPRQTLR